jgi:hypothetical protein
MSKTPINTNVLTACKPREEVLEGELVDAIFAADFGQLIDGGAPKVYGHADTFFRNTEPTPDLKSVGTASFEVRGVKLNSPIKPLDSARTLFNAMQEGMTYGAQLRLKFRAPGRSGVRTQLDTAADKAGDDVSPCATFGKPSATKGKK